MNIVRAKVTSNSCDDELRRVTISMPNVSSHSYLVQSIGNIPLVNGDSVFVLVDEDYSNPIIIGKSLEIKSETSILFRSSDESNEIVATVKPDEFRIDAGDEISLKMTQDSFVVNNGDESMVLGDTLKGLMSDLIDAITQLTVPTSMGPSGTPTNSAKFLQIKNKLDDMLSKKSKLE